MTTSISDRATISNLLSAAYRGQWDAWAAVCDILEETGACDAKSLRNMRRYSKREKGWCVASAEKDLVKAGVLAWSDCPTHQIAVTFHAAVMAVDLDKVPVMTEERIYRKERAVLARKLFTRLGLKGASITAPNYSMASTVDIKLPMRQDFTVDTSSPDNYWAWQEDPAHRANKECAAKIECILALAFPNCDDRSDSQTDYYNYCWSIGD